MATVASGTERTGSCRAANAVKWTMTVGNCVGSYRPKHEPASREGARGEVGAFEGGVERLSLLGSVFELGGSPSGSRRRRSDHPASFTAHGSRPIPSHLGGLVHRVCCGPFRGRVWPATHGSFSRNTRSGDRSTSATHDTEGGRPQRSPTRANPGRARPLGEHQDLWGARDRFGRLIGPDFGLPCHPSRVTPEILMLSDRGQVAHG